MAHVILDEEAKGYGGVVADNAQGLEAVFGNPIHGGHQDLVFRLPPAQPDL